MLTTKEKKKKLTYLSKELTYEKMEQYIALLIRKILFIAWNYKQMPGLDPKIAIHGLGLSSDQETYKELPRKMRQELEDQVCVEVDKWFDVDFI